MKEQVFMYYVSFWQYFMTFFVQAYTGINSDLQHSFSQDNRWEHNNSVLRIGTFLPDQEFVVSANLLVKYRIYNIFLTNFSI